MAWAYCCECEAELEAPWDPKRTTLEKKLTIISREISCTCCGTANNLDTSTIETLQEDIDEAQEAEKKALEARIDKLVGVVGLLCKKVCDNDKAVNELLSQLRRESEAEPHEKQEPPSPKDWGVTGG